MVSNLEKKKKVRSKTVFQKAKGWKEVGMGDNVALFKSQRGCFFAVMGYTKFYIRPAEWKVRKQKKKIDELDDGTVIQMRCASNFLKKKKLKPVSKCKNFGGRFLWKKGVARMKYQIRPEICGCVNLNRSGIRNPEIYKEIQKLRLESLNEIKEKTVGTKVIGRF